MKNFISRSVRKLFGDKEFNDVASCHKKFGITVSTRPPALKKSLDFSLSERAAFIQEELNELSQGISEKNMAEIADALVDIVYVAKGTAVMLGLPWEKLWDDVQRANMAKVAGRGKRGHSIDLIKPPFWVPPRTEEILKDGGYHADA